MKDKKDIIKAKDERIRELEKAVEANILQRICLLCYLEEAECYVPEEEKKKLYSKLTPEQRKIMEEIRSKKL